jgi:NDP-sugar pyrophosphorylase family protein
MTAIILAGGFGTRISHISPGTPKPLIEVAHIPMLERQISFLLSCGIGDIRLSLYHEADQIISFCNARWPKKIEYVVEQEPLGTGGAIKYASRDLKNAFLVINADALTNIDIAGLLARGANTIACTHRTDTRDFGLVKIKENKIFEFLEKPGEKKEGYINCGFYVLDPQIFRDIPHEKFMVEKEVFPALARKGLLNAFIHRGYWLDVGTAERLRQAHLDVATGLV